MFDVRRILWVAAGGALGAIARYALAEWLGTVDDGLLPWGTIAANLAGSFLLGLVAGVLQYGSFGLSVRLFFAVGLLGGFTTFSMLSFENLELLRDARFVAFAFNGIGQTIIGLSMAGAGLMIVRAFIRDRSRS